MSTETEQGQTHSEERSRFHRLSFYTVVAVYVLILVGAVVRSTGSGMGCPDWPKCFGHFIPPTSIDQLPSDYKEKYAAIREKKNVKFAKYLSTFGFTETADRILSDRSILVEADFNPVKTWIEYINRLVGVVIGFMIIALAWQSRTFRKTDPVIFRLAVLTLVAVIFQGWFGSIVVSTNLTTWTITIHMFVAIVIVLMLIYLMHRSDKKAGSTSTSGEGMRQIRFFAIFAMVLLFVQTYLGTEVRSAIDRVSATLPRAEWLLNAGTPFSIHRSISWVIVVANLFVALKIRKTEALKPLSAPLIILILGTFLTGVGMAFLDVPAVLQPLHLLFATMTIGIEALVLFRIQPLVAEGKTVQPS